MTPGPGYANFEEFYTRVYLDEHKDPLNRRIHFAGNVATLTCAALALLSGRWVLLLGCPLLMTGPAYLGHLLFEGNHQSVYRSPLYSFWGSWRMFFDICRGVQPW